MRSCPTCQTEYPDAVEICARDGEALAPAPFTESPVSAGDRDEAVSVASRGDAAAALDLASGGSRVVPETFDSLVGATLAGRYLMIRRIGEGGMGAVYEAQHTIIGKRVAVKVLLEKFLTKSDFVARLLQEARLASAIGHEHIVDVTDFGTTDDGRAFVAMEFLDGESLAQLVMREAPLPVERSLRIARQVASALGAAHAKGIVHRDVKPENVYLIRRGEADFVKVVDFGISKAVKQGQGDEVPDYHLTHTGFLLGTPLYMSPEQARGDEDLDHRVDVWAMGVMLYECLTGEVPFRANNYLGIISQVLTHTATPPSKLRPELGIPEAVESVVMRAMEKDRNRRYPLMADVEHDLGRLLAGDQNVGTSVLPALTPAPPAPTGPARGRLLVWSAAVAALVAGVTLVLARPEAPANTGTTGSNGARAPSSPATSERATTESSATGERAAPSVPVVGLREAGGTAGSGLTPGPRRSDRPARRSAAIRGKVSAGEDRIQDRIQDRVRVEDRLLGPEGRPRTPGKAASDRDDPVIRGVLPSRSGEGYPDN